MKKTIILTVAMAFATFGAFAQQANTAASPKPQMHARVSAEDRAKNQADRINATVQLSADQYAKVLEVTKSFMAQKDALRGAGAPSEDLKAKFKALNEKETAQLKTILTADQYAKLEAARKNHESHRAE